MHPIEWQSLLRFRVDRVLKRTAEAYGRLCKSSTVSQPRSNCSSSRLSNTEQERVDGYGLQTPTASTTASGPCTRVFAGDGLHLARGEHAVPRPFICSK